MTRLDVSLVGHFITTLSFLGIVLYTVFRRRDLLRTTQHSFTLFGVIVWIGSILALINIFRFIYELLSSPESAFTFNLDILSEYSGLIIQSILILALLKNKIVVLPRTQAGRVLAIGAHPDDIEIAAGAALAKMRDAGYQITGLVLTQGERGGDSGLRPKEARSGANFLGIDTIVLCDFTDTRLAQEAGELTGTIENLIHKVEPDIIFTHSYHDLHQDHQAAYEATMRAARRTRTTILCYESPSVTQDFRPTYFIDVCGYVDVKIQAIREHWDQREKPYMKSDLVRSKLAFRGGEAKVEYAEGFEIARMVSAI